MEKSITEKLDKADDKTLAMWWCELNSHKVPKELRSLLPNEQWLCMQAIMDKIGLKECLREWNKESLPGDAFDAWWRSRPIK